MSFLRTPASVIFSSVLIVTTLSGCGGSGSGAETQALPNTGGGSGSELYVGPAAQTDDVQNFKLNVWDNLQDDNRCGSCHGVGGQSPAFVRDDDINLAYAAANDIVNLSQPSESRMVTKVAGGHNCWESNDNVCADIITGWISSWAGAGGAGATTISLTAPDLVDPGSSKSLPTTSSDFETLIYDPYLEPYCSGCHSEDATFSQQPYIASSDVDVAYQAVQSKIDLENPENSRLVLRLGSEFHNCWSNCSSNADAMLTAIQAFAGSIPETTIDPELVVSKALRLVDGIVASSGGRYESNMVALYEFKTGEGTTAFDTSGVSPSLNLSISGDTEWVGGWGVTIRDGKLQGSTSDSKKLYDLITATSEYSIEAWVAPANVTQDGPARIVSYSGGSDIRNFTLGQTLYNYNFLNRSSVADGNGEPALSTPDADEVLQATLQHVVITFDPVNGRHLYVNGELEVEPDPLGGGSISDWDDSFAFVIGDEVSNNEPWAGTVRLVAVYNRALNQEQVTQNFDVGVGEKYFLLFGISHLVDMPDAYVVIEVSQFDNYSYLFSEPKVLSLDADAAPADFTVKGIRIGINGKEAVVGQAYSNVDMTISSSNYTSEGLLLSPLGTIIAQENGPSNDQFFLTFEQLGEHSHVVVEAELPTPALPADLPAESDIGVRNFEEISVTMSTITGVAVNTSNVQSIYNTVIQALPPTPAPGSYLASHQMAVTQLAVQYCTALVSDSTLRASFFPAFDFSQTSSPFASATERDKITEPLTEKTLNASFSDSVNDLATQPLASDFKSELDSLMNQIGSSNTQEIIQATCAAALGSAAVILQ